MAPRPSAHERGPVGTATGYGVRPSAPRLGSAAAPIQARRRGRRPHGSGPTRLLQGTTRIALHVRVSGTANAGIWGPAFALFVRAGSAVATDTPSAALPPAVLSSRTDPWLRLARPAPLLGAALHLRRLSSEGRFGRRSALIGRISRVGPLRCSAHARPSALASAPRGRLASPPAERGRAVRSAVRAHAADLPRWPAAVLSSRTTSAALARPAPLLGAALRLHPLSAEGRFGRRSALMRRICRVGPLRCSAGARLAYETCFGGLRALAACCDEPGVR